MRHAHPPMQALAPREAVTSLRAAVPCIALAAVLGAVAHLVVRGFTFGVLNNVYHVPFVLRLYDTPAFASDAFYQSLRGYVSLVWPLLRLVATDANVEALFLAAHVLALLLAFAALALGLVALRVQPRMAVVLVVTLAALTPVASQITPVGRELLLGGYFTHTEFVHGLALLLFASAIGGNVRAMFVLAGVAVDVNVFAGAWLMFVATVVALADPADSSWRSRLRTLAPPLALGLLAAAPAIAWTAVTVLRTGVPGVPADYRAYLREFFPYHFLIDSTPPVGLVGYVAQIVAAVAALHLLSSAGGLHVHERRRLRAALAACVALIAGGAVLPYLTDARLLLNLHLLRAAALTWWLALLLAMGALAVLATRCAGDRSARLLATATALALVGVDWPLAALGLSIAAWQTAATGGRAPRAHVALVGVAALLVVANVALARLPLENLPEIATAALALVAALARRVRGARRGLVIGAGAVAVIVLAAQVDRDDATLRAIALAAALAVVMIAMLPGVVGVPSARLPLAFGVLLAAVCTIDATRAWSWRMHRAAQELPERQDVALLASWAARHLPAGTVLTPPWLDPDFQWQSRHPAWVTWRSGAAVMWSPSFYPQWSTRIHEVEALADPAARVAYACAHAIPYILEAGAPPDGVDVLRREGRHALLAPRCHAR